jgi:hypothetical protein
MCYTDFFAFIILIILTHYLYFQPSTSKEKAVVEAGGTDYDEPKKESKRGPKKQENFEFQVMADISRCMSSVAGLVNQPSTSTSADTDNHKLWAQLLAQKLNKIDDFRAEEFKIETDRKILDLMKSDPKPKE